MELRENSAKKRADLPDQLGASLHQDETLSGKALAPDRYTTGRVSSETATATQPVQGAGSNLKNLSAQSQQVQQTTTLDALQIHALINQERLTYRHCACPLFFSFSTTVGERLAVSDNLVHSVSHQAIAEWGQVSMIRV